MREVSTATVRLLQDNRVGLVAERHDSLLAGACLTATLARRHGLRVPLVVLLAAGRLVHDSRPSIILAAIAKLLLVDHRRPPKDHALQRLAALEAALGRVSAW